MIKKLLAMTLILAVCSVGFVGCGSDKDKKDKATEAKQETKAADEQKDTIEFSSEVTSGLEDHQIGETFTIGGKDVKVESMDAHQSKQDGKITVVVFSKLDTSALSDEEFDKLKSGTIGSATFMTDDSDFAMAKIYGSPDKKYVTYVALQSFDSQSDVDALKNTDMSISFSDEGKTKSVTSNFGDKISGLETISADNKLALGE